MLHEHIPRVEGEGRKAAPIDVRNIDGGRAVSRCGKRFDQPSLVTKRAWLDDAALTIAKLCQTPGITERSVEAALQELQDRTQPVMPAFQLNDRDRAALARQIAVWFAWRDFDTARRLTRDMLAMFA